MCFSVEQYKELKRLAVRFQAEVTPEDEAWYESMRQRAQDKDFLKSALNLTRKPSSEFFREASHDQRIFPGYFTNVLVHENGKNVFKKMRYRVRPANSSSEIPTKYNVFNARLDSLEVRDTWKKIFMKQHGLFPFSRFYEWVEHDGKKKLISFAPKDREVMWAPCLFDYWEDKKSGFGFYSFALLTDEPPEEVLRMGHDRCPIFLQENLISDWLRPQLSNKQYIYDLLKKKESVYYENQWAAA